MGQGIQVYFIINPDLAGNRQRLYYGKRNSYFIVLCLFLGTCGLVFKGIRRFVFCFHILGFQYFIKRENTFDILNIFLLLLLSICNFFQVYNFLS